ncbi:MAG: VanW family protein [Armatimonadetes bacterium]|nr:VanW family protein [Armatimonadota bacterium]
MRSLIFSKQFVWIAIRVGPVLLVALGLGVQFGFLASGRIAPGVRVGSVDVGSLTRGEAQARLTDWSRQRLQDELAFVAGDRRWVGKLVDLGITPDAEAMLESAYALGRTGGFLARIGDALGPKNLSPVYHYDKEKIDSVREKIVTAVTVQAEDAKLSFRDGARTITPEVIGTTIDFERSFKQVRSAVENRRDTVVMEIVPERPAVTMADLDPVDTLLGGYTTRFPAWRRDRTHNVKLAAAGIDGNLIRPGEVFSYNGAVGPRVKENGFRDALIYLRGKVVPGTGGGVCQVSSTLYNAALLANLEIVERSHHSMRVPYVPMGRDATVAYGLLDLKFRNSTSAPIYIAAGTSGSRLTVQIYGSATDKKDVQIITTAPKPVTKQDGKRSYSVTVYRVVSENGVERFRQRISRDRYDPAPPPEEKPRPRIGKRSPGSEITRA